MEITGARWRLTGAEAVLKLRSLYASGDLEDYFWLHGSLKAVIALPLGHLLACFSDTFTKQGVQLFYPEPVWAISVSNPRRRLKTGGAGELWVLGGAIALLRDQYALGTVEVRIVRSPPSY